MFEKIVDIAEKNRSNYVSFIRSLVKASKNGEKAVQCIVSDKLSKLGCEVDKHNLYPVELNADQEFAAEKSIEKRKHLSVVGKYTGSNSERSLMFFAHPDSEELRGLDEWEHPPFKAEIDNGRIYGWGIADDLLGVAIMTEAIELINNLNIELRGDVYLCSTPSKRNARGVLSILNQGYIADGAIYLHPAESGEGLGEIKAFASGLLKLLIRINGQPPKTTEPGHTAFAHLGINPIKKSSSILKSLEKLDSERANIVHHKKLEDAVGRSTNILIGSFNCGEKDGLTRMPDECTIGVSITFPPTEDMNDVKKKVEKTIKEIADDDPWLKDNPPELEWIFGTQGVEVPSDHPLYETTKKSIFEVTGKQPHVNPLHSASDIRNPMLFRDIPTVGFGSLSGNLVQSGGHDEWIDIDSYIDAIKVCARIIQSWCNTV